MSHWLFRSIMRRRFKLEVLIGILIPMVILYYMIASWSAEVKIPLNDGKQCNESLGPSIKDDIEKVKKYSFPGVEKYITELFPHNLPDEQNMPQYPVFVTAASASHYTELMDLVYNTTAVRKKYPQIKLVIYDLGFGSSQVKKIQEKCDCEIRKLVFEAFPDHVKILKGYAWKPIVIQMAAKEHPFVFWMDASVRFVTTDLDGQLEDARNLGVIGTKGFGSIASRTHTKTLRFLGEQPCTFKDTMELEATFIIIYANKLVSEMILKPWVSCALSLGCLVPDLNTDQYLHCKSHKEPVYFECHRFDQSILSILTYRLYHLNIEKHKMTHTFFRFCKGVDEQWYLPQFLNEMYIRYNEHCF
ncbi:hypothetical protein ACF0H5_017366 [Mactra antiquata]